MENYLYFAGQMHSFFLQSLKMKHLILFGILFWLVSPGLSAKKLPGYYINEDNDTTRVTFYVPLTLIPQGPHFEKMQFGIEFENAAGKKEWLRPDEAQEIGYELEGRQYRMLSRYNSLGKTATAPIFEENIFLHLIRDGRRLQLFRHYKTTDPPPTYNKSTKKVKDPPATHTEEYVLQKDGGALFRPFWITFRKDMSAYLADCPTLAKKIDKKEYRSSDLEKIVDEYNQICK